MGTFGGNGVKSVIGHPMGAQVGYVADGIFKSQDEIDNHANRMVQNLDVYVGKTWMAIMSLQKQTKTGFIIQHQTFLMVLMCILNTKTLISQCSGKAYKV